jgi:hypothetical protein
LQSNDSCNKVKAKVHQDSGKLGAKFTMNKTILEFKKGGKKININYAHSFMEFENMLQGQYRTAGTCQANSLKQAKLLSCHGALYHEGSAQKEATTPAVHLYDARWQL